MFNGNSISLHCEYTTFWLSTIAWFCLNLNKIISELFFLLFSCLCLFNPAISILYSLSFHRLYMLTKHHLCDVCGQGHLNQGHLIQGQVACGPQSPRDIIRYKGNTALLEQRVNIVRSHTEQIADCY